MKGRVPPPTVGREGRETGRVKEEEEEEEEEEES